MLTRVAVLMLTLSSPELVMWYNTRGARERERVQQDWVLLFNTGLPLTSHSHKRLTGKFDYLITYVVILMWLNYCLSCSLVHNVWFKINLYICTPSHPSRGDLFFSLQIEQTKYELCRYLKKRNKNGPIFKVILLQRKWYINIGNEAPHDKVPVETPEGVHSRGVRHLHPPHVWLWLCGAESPQELNILISHVWQNISSLLERLP